MPGNDARDGDGAPQHVAPASEGIDAAKERDGDNVTPMIFLSSPWLKLLSAFGLTGTFGLALALSAVIQVGFVIYLVLEVPPPPRPTAIDIMDDRIVQMVLIEALEEEPPPEPEEEEEVIAALEPEPEPRRPEPEPEPEPEADPEPEVEPEPELALEPVPDEEPEGLALESIGSGTAGGAIQTGNRTVGEAAQAQTQRSRRSSVSEEEEEEEPRRRRRRERPRAVPLEDAGTPPELVDGEPRLGYPREFREQAIAGLVIVQCIITDTGRVRACRYRSGPEELADYVISVVRRWQYSPAEDHDGDAIAVAYTYRVPFRLL